MIMYARWWKENRLNDPKETAIRDGGSDLEDPPPTSRATASSRGSWEQVSSTPTKGYRGPTGKGNTKPSPKRENPTAEEYQKTTMDATADPAVIEEIKALELKLALLKDKARGSQ